MLHVSLPLGGNHGWGICGRYLTAALAARTEVAILTPAQPYPVAVDGPVLHAVSGQALVPSDLNIWSKTFNVGLAFTEDIAEATKNVANAYRYYDHIICGSTWCAEQLAALGIKTSVAIQGVDYELFHPSTNRFDEGNFTIGSFGKLEHRKGQDILASAVGALQRKHPNMWLVTCWANHWDSNWRSSRDRLLLERGVIRHIQYDAISHSSMLYVYRMCDMAVFPNRCEAGTNLPLMECMACGVPVAGVIATGQGDILTVDNCQPIDFTISSNGWAEPDLESTINAIEVIYENRREASALAVSNALKKEWPWSRMAASVLEVFGL